MAKCLYARGAYLGILSSRSFRGCEEIHTIFAAEVRRRCKNLRTSQTKNLYQPVGEGGLGVQPFFSMVQQRKWNCVHRLLAHGDQWTQLAVQALCARGHLSPYHSSISSLTPQWVLGVLFLFVRISKQFWSNQATSAQIICCSSSAIRLPHR